MDNWNSLLSITNAVIAVTVYTFSIFVYRLFFHPLSRFPGPKLAAITPYYEAYFDVYQRGQYTFKIGELHKKYGPIIRISPHELHVNDPAFFDTLYRQDAHYDKYDWVINAFAADGATIFTTSHDLHKTRRQPLAAFFSQARVAAQQGLAHRHLSKLGNRLEAFAKAESTFDLGAAITALARDVANDFILDKSYNSLDREDFDAFMIDASSGFGAMWRLTKFVRFVSHTLRALPIPLIMKVADSETKIFFRHLQETQDDTKRLMAAATSPGTENKASRNVVDLIMKSKLPPSEKKFKRVFNDMSTVAAAGFETTASVLRLVIFHIFNDKRILQRLRNELASAGDKPGHSLDWKALEQLPYLTAILQEGLRLSPAIATRMARVSQKTDIAYREWCIPKGTPVGMTLILMHMDEESFPNAKLFDPERWLEGGVLKKTDRAYAPFSKGTRNCLGMHLAWAEMYLTVANLTQCFDFNFPSATAEDFECVADHFAIETKCRGRLFATVASRVA